MTSLKVVQFVAADLTSRQIAGHLVLAPETVSTCIEVALPGARENLITHIPAKLDAARHAEITAGCATVRRHARSER